MRTVSEIVSACNVWFLSQNLLLSKDWRLEIMKTLDRPESFFKKIFKTFSSKISKKKMRCFWWPISQQFHKSLIIVKYHLHHKVCDVTRISVFVRKSQTLTINGNISDFIDNPLPKDSVSAHGASHHAWAPGPHHLNPALMLSQNILCNAK